MATVNELLVQANELFKEKNYQGLIDLLPEEVLEKHKSDVLYMVKAGAYYELMEYDLCKRSAEMALALNPLNAFAFNSIGNVYYSKGQYEDAVEQYKNAIELDLRLSSHHNNLGIAYYQLKQYEKAIEAYNNAIELDPKNANIYSSLGDAHYNLNQYEKAIEAYNNAIELDPKNASINNSLGNAYNNLNQYEKAIEVYNQATKSNAGASYAYNGLGISYYNLHQYNKALESYSNAIKIDQKYSDPYYNRALIYLDQKQYMEAIFNFNKYIELTKDNPNYYTSLAKEKIVEIGKLIEDSAYGEIDTLINKIKELLLYKDESVTHYTSMTVAKTLILNKDSNFRLSEGAYLNDTSEGRELFKYLFLTSTPVDGHDTVAEPFAKKPFIGSFVAEGKHDDLTLWRMYGKEAKEEARGWAITLHRDELIKKLQEHFAGFKKEGTLNDDNEFNFYRVAYCKREDKSPFTIPSGKKTAEKKLNGYMKDLAAKVKDFEEKRAGNTADKQKLLELLNEIAYLFKSYEYQYEHEIRLVLKGTGIDKIVDMNVTPPKVYIELINIRPVLRKITLGPKVEKSDEWASALFYALDKDGLNPDILISHLPFK